MPPYEEARILWRREPIERRLEDPGLDPETREKFKLVRRRGRSLQRFFSEEDAKKEAKSFEERGYDTYIRSSPAFSTLGWFNDPLLTDLLKYDRVTLAEIIFHELFHNTLFVKGSVDFNESLANFVGSHSAPEKKGITRRKRG